MMMMPTVVLTVLFLAIGPTCLVASWAAIVGGGGLRGFARALLITGVACLLLAAWGGWEIAHAHELAVIDLSDPSMRHRILK